MSVFPTLPGVLTLEMTSADPETALCAISALGIDLKRIQKQSDLTYVYSIRRSSYPAVLSLCKKQGNRLRILNRKGPYWAGKNLLKRPVFLFSLTLFLFLSLFLPSRVLFVTVQGNEQTPAKKILYTAQECGISFGSSRREVRSEKVKNALLSAMPELQWVGVNTSGCVAVISVREREPVPVQSKASQVTNLNAARDGYILSMTVTNGNPLCAPGQYVKQGQTLVSGYRDCGIFIQAGRAEGEIEAQTARNLTVLTPSQTGIRTGKERTTRKYSLLIGKKRINLWKDSGILDATCGRIYEEKYAALPGGFRLPIALCIETISDQPTQVISLSVEDCQSQLSAFAGRYLKQQMQAGQVLSGEEFFSLSNGLVVLEGEYTCQENIGRTQQLQIGDEYVKTHGTDR